MTTWSPRGDLGTPAGFHNDGLIGFDDQSRSVDPLTGRQVFAQIDAGIVPLAATEHWTGAIGCGEVAGHRQFRFHGASVACVGGFDPDGLDDHSLVAVIDEPELRLVGGLEGTSRTVDRTVGEVDGDRGVGAVVAQVQERSPGD